MTSTVVQNNTKRHAPVHCTSVGVAPRLQLLPVPFPRELRAALKSGLKESSTTTQLCRSYVQCVKSLKDITTIPEKDYLFLFKILLYLERYQEEQEAEIYTVCTTLKKINDSEFQVPVPLLNVDEPFVNVDDLANIEDLQANKKFVAVVTNIKQMEIVIRPFPFFLKKWNELIEYKISFKPQDWPMKCYNYALHMMNECQLTSIVYPTIVPSYITLEGNLDWFNRSISKNEEQKQAVMNILKKMAYPAPYILFGPPGTGKTMTLVEVICQIWRQDSSKHVLVCAPSNAAVDEIAKRLLKIVPSQDIYRMYAPAKKWNSIAKSVQPCANFIDNEHIFLPKDIVILKKIVIVTLVSCIRLVPLNFRESHFSYIIIDETSQAIEPQTLIPLVLSCGEDSGHIGRLQSQLVIAGDPYQLGPIVRSDLAKHLLGKSMLERLMDCEPYRRDENGKYNPQYITKLVKNFRSHKEILKIPNKLFYDGELEACGGKETRKALKWPFVKNNFPLIFCNVNGQECSPENSMSKYNREEILMVIKYVDLLLKLKLKKTADAIKQSDIGVVTPYKEQHNRIRKELDGRKCFNVTVGTVEIFQGQERDVIIISTVRTNNIGFLSNYKRFNVAITRAKALLIIVGNADLLRKDPYWRKLIVHCEEHGALTGPI